jgi:hypothetical protein
MKKAFAVAELVLVAMLVVAPASSCCSCRIFS